MVNPYAKNSTVMPSVGDGHTRICNDILDALISLPLSGAEFKVALAIIRKTWGWGKSSVDIAWSELCRQTGLSKSGAKKAVKGLLDKRVILVEEGPAFRGGNLNVMGMNRHYDTWQRGHKCDGVTNVTGSQTCQKGGPNVSKGGSKRDPIKEKKVIKEIMSDCFARLWQAYPKKDGRKEAERHFNASIKKWTDLSRIWKALENYLDDVKDTDRKFIKNGSTWFNNWEDWEAVERNQQSNLPTNPEWL